MGCTDHLTKDNTFIQLEEELWNDDNLFYFITDLDIINTFVIWKLNKKGTDKLTFRMYLAKQWKAGFSSRKHVAKPVLYKTMQRIITGVPDRIHLQKAK